MQNILHLFALAAEPRSSRFWPTVLATLVLWHRRSRSRRDFARLDDRDLADIGRTRADQWAECRKHFWQA
jgi:uncharacterized protein YjiS (DUF1127 family)